MDLQQQVKDCSSLHMEAMLVSFMKAVNNPVCVVDWDRCIILANERFSQTFRLQAEDLIGKRCHEVLQSQDCFTDNCCVKLLSEHPDSDFIESRIHLPGSEKAVYQVRSVPWSDPESEQGGAILFYHQETIKEDPIPVSESLMTELAKSNQELKDFAYIISHDLKAPLRGIRTLVDWLMADYGEALGDEGREQMNLLLNRVGRMHDLIEGVLQYSRIGRLCEERVAVNLNEVLPEVIDLLALPDHIQIYIDTSLPDVITEPTRIHQVFQNLLSNSIKYMDKDQGEIHVGCREDDAVWTFYVKDNGPGIHEEHFERIFRIFQTLVPKDEFESTGVGLSLVKKIVELYGGTVWVESEVSQGSTFFFTLTQD